MNILKIINLTKYNIIAGVLLALVLTTLSVRIYNVPYNFIDEEKKEIDFNSMSSLSLSLEDSTNDMLFLKVNAGMNRFQVENGSEYQANTIFYKSISSIEIIVRGDDNMVNHYLDPIDENWWYTISNAVYHEFNEKYLPLLHDAFYKDISTIDNLENITDNSVVEISKANAQNSSYYIELSHIYRDGSMLQFYLWDEVMIFQYYKLTTFISSGGNMDQYGPILKDQIYPTYKAKVDGNVLSNYIDTMNDILIKMGL